MAKNVSNCSSKENAGELDTQIDRIGMLVLGKTNIKCLLVADILVADTLAAPVSESLLSSVLPEPSFGLGQL